MQNTKTKIVTLLLLSALAIAVFPLSVHASTGNILINTAVAPSTPGQQVPAGGNVSLNFAGVTFSGAQFYLLMSLDGLSQLSTGDSAYTPTTSATMITVANLRAAAITTYTIGNYKWDVGFNWVNGSIQLNIAGGNYFIKAYDGATTAVAVTDTFITLTPAVAVTPNAGNPSTPLVFRGFAFTTNSLLNLSYFNPITATYVSLQNLTAVNASGIFEYPINAPDLLQALAAGQNTIANNTITFRAVNATGSATTYDTIPGFDEFSRGLAQVRVTGAGGAQQNAAAGTLFGNNTLFTTGSVNEIAGVGVTKVLRIAGNYFYPGNMTTRWDNVVVANTAPTINATGWFNTTLTVPPAAVGNHNITLTDGNNVVFTIFVTVVPTLSLSPTSGPGGTVVTATGYGFPAPSAGVVVNATLAWPGLTNYVGSAFVDATGSFVATFTVPVNSLGGENTVTALQNATGAFVSTATAVFTVTSQFAVSPSSFANNGSTLVTATGTGFKVGSTYQVNIDNNLLGFAPLGDVFQTGIQPNASGTITFQFVGAGFNPGTHAVSLYENNTAVPAAVAPFTVTGDAASTTATLLEAINKTTSQLALDLKAINATIIAINGNTATLSTSIGTITASISAVQSSVSSLSGTVSGLSGSISSISSGMATIQTSLGTVQTSLANIDPVIGLIAGDTTTIKTSLGTITTSLDSIGTKVTAINGDTATIKTDLGTLQGTVTSVSNGVATIQTSLGTMQADVSTIKTDAAESKTNTANLSPLVIVAIVLALIAAIAAIASIVLMRRKIAG